MNSFSAIQRAIDYEIERQIQSIETNIPVIQETRLWDESNQCTMSMRRKEGSSDYRYFPEPDLTPIELSSGQLKNWQGDLPELPAQKRHRYVSSFGLSAYDARVLTEDRPMAEYFESVIAAGANPKQSANWIMGDITAHLKTTKQSISQLSINPSDLAELIHLIEANTISSKIAKEILPELLVHGGSPQSLIDQKGLTQISDTGLLMAAIDKVLTANPQELEQYRQGKTKLLGFFVGQVMKQTGGRADPKLTNQLLMHKLTD
jgi:aspartyl-tRNA(Asn)/glutamyl-tRNA(Gln) amidotransferase subunit B